MTPERLREAFAYNSGTGLFTWRISPRNGINIGDVAGTIGPYVALTLDRQRERAHRWAVLYVTSEMPSPDMEVDHRNGIGTDNRWANLRVVTPQVNSLNVRAARSTSRSGRRGVHRHSTNDAWIAQITVNGKTTHLGSFASVDDASAAYEAARLDLHGGLAIYGERSPA